MKIDKAVYQGYVWYSDQTKPQVIDGEYELEISDSKNPFIVEGQLYDGKTSISIKFVDGKYIVKEYSLSDISKEETTDEEFVPNRMDNIVKLNFKRVWREVKDELCEGMKVLKPAELVFVGFKKGDKQNDKSTI